MPETPEQFWERTHGALRTPPLADWDTWPFSGEVRPRELERPLAVEAPRHGEGGIDCRACMRGAEGALWSDERWVVHGLDRPSGLPVVVILETREHLDLPDLSDRLAAELGPLMLKVQKAVFAVGEIGNVHVCRWGDGSEHFHLWFMARPARVSQLSGSFAAIWDDILPPLPTDVWQANLAIVQAELSN